MRADATFEHGVAIDVQMLRRNCGGDVVAGIIDKGDRICRGDMFKNDAQLRQVPHEL